MAANESGIFHTRPINTPEEAANFLFKELYKALDISYSGNAAKPLGSVNVVMGGIKRAKLTLGSVGPITLAEAKTGILELYSILTNPSLMQELVKRTFADIITPVIQQRWLARGGNDFHYGREGISADIESAGEEEGEHTSFKVRYNTSRPAGEFTQAGMKVGKLLTDPTKIRTISSTGVGIAGIDELIQNSQIHSNSSFNSVFMMLEFGAGEFAIPAARLFSGSVATPFKVPPQVDAPPGAWYQSRSMQLQALLYFGKAYGRNERSLRKIKEKLKKNYPNFGGFARYPIPRWNPGYKPQPTLFQNRRVAAQIVEALRTCGPYLVRLIGEKVKKKVPNFPFLNFQTSPRRRNVGVGLSL